MTFIIQPQMANVKQTNKPQNIKNNATQNMSNIFGKSFLEQVAKVVSGSTSSEQQKMQSRKREYTNKKKVKDLEDERCELLGRIRMIGNLSG
ncbi:hypothetical protein ACFL4D_02605 [Candidatus Margulisiibacteriota bacterium]